MKLKLEGLLDEIPVPIGTATVLLYTQPTLCGEGGVGGVELLERHPELQLEGLLEEVLGQVLFLSEAEVGQPLQIGLGGGQQLAVPLL